LVLGRQLGQGGFRLPPPLTVGTNLDGAGSPQRCASNPPPGVALADGFRPGGFWRHAAPALFTSKIRQNWPVEAVQKGAE
jgi:hypothetical protein